MLLLDADFISADVIRRRIWEIGKKGPGCFMLLCTLLSIADGSTDMPIEVMAPVKPSRMVRSNLED